MSLIFVAIVVTWQWSDCQSPLGILPDAEQIQCFSFSTFPFQEQNSLYPILPYYTPVTHLFYVHFPRRQVNVLSLSLCWYVGCMFISWVSHFLGCTVCVNMHTIWVESCYSLDYAMWITLRYTPSFTVRGSYNLMGHSRWLAWYALRSCLYTTDNISVHTHILH